MSFQKFLQKLIVLTIVLGAIVAAINYFVPFFQAFQVFTWISLAFFFLLASFTGYIGVKGIEKKTAYGFVASVNAIVMIKIFLSVILVIIYSSMVHPENISFISSFFFFYVVYTIFEIRELITMQRIKDKAAKADASIAG